MRNASGIAWFDCLQLEEYECANDFNALQNGDFSSDDYWLTNDNQAITVQDNAVVINGEAGAYEEPTTVYTDDSESENTDKSDLELPTTVTTVECSVPDSYIFTYDDYGNVTGEFHGTVNKTIQKVYLAETEDDSSTDATISTTTYLRIAQHHIMCLIISTSIRMCR